MLMSQLWRRTTDDGRNVKIELFWNRIRNFVQTHIYRRPKTPEASKPLYTLLLGPQAYRVNKDPSFIEIGVPISKLAGPY